MSCKACSILQGAVAPGSLVGQHRMGSITCEQQGGGACVSAIFHQPTAMLFVVGVTKQCDSASWPPMADLGCPTSFHEWMAVKQVADAQAARRCVGHKVQERLVPALLAQQRQEVSLAAKEFVVEVKHNGVKVGRQAGSMELCLHLTRCPSWVALSSFSRLLSHLSMGTIG